MPSLATACVEYVCALPLVVCSTGEHESYFPRQDCRRRVRCMHDVAHRDSRRKLCVVFEKIATHLVGFRFFARVGGCLPCPARLAVESLRWLICAGSVPSLPFKFCFVDHGSFLLHVQTSPLSWVLAWSDVFRCVAQRVTKPPNHSLPSFSTLCHSPTPISPRLRIRLLRGTSTALSSRTT